jgi:drug/metabolite transporter (DMT)-like permease
MAEPLFPSRRPPAEPRPAVGYAMVAAAAVLFGVNGTVSKVALSSGLSSVRLTEARSAGALLGLAVVVLLTAPRSLRTTRRELPRLALFGIVGVAFVQWFYFVAIHRLAVGIALLIQYLAPLLIALWARYVGHEHVRRRIWAALALALAGLGLIVQIWNGVHLDGIGLAAAFASAAVYAFYILSAERAIVDRDTISLLCWGFLFATVFWSIAQPWWSFPARAVARTVTLQGHLAGVHLPVWALVLWVVVLGTIAPFGLVVGALRHISATRAGVTAMLEPVVATVVAWVWLGETLGAVQLAGAAVVLAGILLAQTAR